MKKIWSLVLCMCLMLAMPNLGLATDVVENAAKEPLKLTSDDFVQVLSERGIITGYEDGSFGLENEITRAEFSAIAVRMMDLEGLAKSSDYKTEFSDVSVGQWYTGYINAATGKNLLKGYDDKTFRPDKKITLAEAVTITVRIIDGDVIYGHWPTNYLLRASELGIFEDVTMSEAMAPASRGTVFRLIYNAMFNNNKNIKLNDTIVRGLVVSNDRVNGVENGSIVIELLENLNRENMALERGIQFKYKLKDTEDPEVFLGKVVDVDFLGEDIRSISIDPNYNYLTGKITNIKKNSFELDERKYSVEKKDLTGNSLSDTRLYEIYIDGYSADYSEFEEVEEFEFAKVTVINGKVLFVDAFEIENVGPIKSVNKTTLRVRDNSNNALSDKVTYDDKDLLQFVKVGENVDIKRLVDKTFNVGEIVYHGNGFIIVDKSPKIIGMFETLKRSKNIVVVKGKEYDLNFEEEPIGNVIFSSNMLNYEVLDEDSYIDNVKNSVGETIALSLDIYGNVQTMEVTPLKDSGMFAVVYDMFGDKLKMRDSNNSNKVYTVDIGAKFGKMDLKDLYDEKAIEKLQGITEIEFEELKELIKDDKKDALVYFTLKNNLVDSIVIINMEDAWFKTTKMEKDYIEIDDPIKNDYYDQDEYDFENTKVLVLGTRMQVMNPTSFLSRYAVSKKYPLDATLVTYKDFGNQVKFLFTKPAGNDAGAKTKEIVRKIIDIDLSEYADFVELEDVEGNKIKHKVVSSRVSKMLDAGEIEEGDVVEASVLYNTDRDVMKLKLLVEESSSYVYKVLDITSREISLGFDTAVDTDVDDFKDENKFNVDLAKDIKKFGEIDEADFVVIHYDEDQEIDTILKVDEPDELAQGGQTYFAEVSLTSGMFGFKALRIKHSPVGKFLKVDGYSEYKEFDSVDPYYCKSEDRYVKIFIADEDMNDIGEIEIIFNKDNEKSYPIKIYE